MDWQKIKKMGGVSEFDRSCREEQSDHANAGKSKVMVFKRKEDVDFRQAVSDELHERIPKQNLGENNWR